jgi:signal transduction histidine kinase/ActR/RegA family two-component response regulator
MKKTIFLLYILTLFLVFVSALAWEFWLEPPVQSFFKMGYIPETFTEHWAFVRTISFFSAIALIIPALMAMKVEEKRQPPLKTIELASVKQEFVDKKHKQILTKNGDETTNISLQTLIDSISDSIMVIDRNYQVQMLNKAAKDIHLDDSDPPKILLCHKLSHNADTPCTGPEHECPFTLVLETGKSCTVLHHHLNKHGEAIPFEIQASPVFDNDGEVTGIIELARDVSDRLAMEKKQREADARLVNLQREESIATLAGGLSHEFNNTLTSILGNAELLSVRLNRNDVNRKQADAIITGSEHLADLTSQLLAYAKGGKNLNQTVTINAQITDSLRLTYSGKFSDIEVELDLDEDLWPVLGDPVQISQLIINIIINGFEALEKIEGKLIIRTANLTKTEKWMCYNNIANPPGDYVLITVTNTGVTISEKILDKIFEPFFSTKFTGRGMGLAAAHGIVQNHNGCISVKSGSDQTTFQVFLPREISDEEIIMAGSETSDDAPRLKILVVDDEHQVLSTIKDLLDHHGCTVLSADKGLEALEVIKRHKADLDLVILDIQMPDMSGDEVYTRLKKIKPDLKVLISSGFEEFTALNNVLLDPQDKFIKKPFKMSDLMLKINELTIKD